MWEIYSIGDSAFLEQVLNAVAMITGTGDFTAMVRIGLLIGVLLVSVQAILQGGRGIQFQQILVSWLVFATLFGPSTRVAIEDAYSGQVRVVDNVPIGVAAAGSTISTVGFQITRLFETAFSTPAMTEYGFASSLQTLARLRKQVMDRTGLGSANRIGGADMEASWFNYLKECTLIGIDIGQKSLDELLNDPNPLSAVRFDSRIYGTQVILSGGNPQDLDCTTAYTQLVQMTEASFLPQLRQVLSAALGTASGTETDDQIRAALNNLGLAAVNAQHYMTAAVLLPIYEQSVTGKYLDDQAFTAATMVNQAIEQRNTQWAAEQTLFQSIVRPMMTFFEGFIYAITPLMAFVIALGQIGLRMAGRYLLMLLWIQLWMPVMAIINLYVHLSVSGRMAALDSLAGTELPSFAAMMQMDTVLQTWLATGGMLASSVPAISLMLVYGSAITATHLAGRLQGGDFIDERLHTPDVARNAPVMQSQALFQNAALTGSAMTGATNLLSSFSVGSSVSTMVGSARESLQQATESFSQQVGQTLSRSFGERIGIDSLASIGSQVASTRSSSSDMVNSVTEDLQHRYGFGDDKKDAVRGLVAGVLSGGLRVGADGSINHPHTKEVADDSLLGKLLGTRGQGSDGGQHLLPGIDSPASSNTPRIRRLRAGMDLGGDFRSQIEASEQSGRSMTANTLTGELHSLSTSDSRRAEFRDAMVTDLSNARREGVERSLSDQDYQTLLSSAQDVVTAAERYSQLDQASYALNQQRNTDGTTLTRQAASQPEVMEYLGRYMAQHVEAASRMRDKLPMYQRLLPDDNQAYVAASLEALTHSTSSTPAERDNDHQAALQVIGMATGADFRDVQARRHEGLQADTPTPGEVAARVQQVAPGDGASQASAAATVFGGASENISALQAAAPAQIDHHAEQSGAAVADAQAAHGQNLQRQAGDIWRQRIMQDDSGVSKAEMFFRATDKLGELSGKHTEAAKYALEQFGIDYDSYREARLKNPQAGGALHQSGAASQASWEGFRSAYTAGTAGENPLAAFRDGYAGSEQQFLREANWGTKVEAVLAGALGAAASNRYGEYLEQHASAFQEEAYREARTMGLTDLQSRVFAQSFNEGLLGRITNEGKPESWSLEMQGLRAEMLDQYRDDRGNVADTDRAFVDRQIGTIANASLAGDYARTNLINLRAYNEAVGDPGR
jgi:conjugal transfer mating pair stabilization protein TraG